MIRRPVVLAVLLGACHGNDEAVPDAAIDGARIEAGDAIVALANTGDADASEGPRIWALKMVTPIFNKTELPPKDPETAPPEQRDVVRIGYMRKGSSARYKGEPLKKPNCNEGWYELVDGGFVCGKFATTDPKSPDLAEAPHAPYAERPLPYDYGMSMGTGVPLYYRIPTVKEREKLESSIPVSKDKEPKKEKQREEKEKTYGEDNPYTAQTSDDPNTPWFLKQQTGEKPKVSLEDLRKSGRGDLIERRMVKGFYVALDTVISIKPSKKDPLSLGRPEKYWRTARGLIVPYEHILVHEPKEDMKGIWLNAPGQNLKLPFAFVTAFKAHKYKVTLPDGGAPGPKKDEKGKPQARAKRLSDAFDRWQAVQLTGKVVFDEHFREYYELADGSGYLRDSDISEAVPGPKPDNVGVNEKWIDVNLKTQTLIAFEGETPIFATLVSSGRHSDDPAQDHHTPKGDFRIWEKHISATMEEDTATDGPYSIEDVPWIQYFHGGYALHGAFWHAKFGHERSHGCINLAPVDAKALFGWTLPRLPDGWHGVRALPNTGTRVIVHD
jgi:hypothetical protein